MKNKTYLCRYTVLYPILLLLLLSCPVSEVNGTVIITRESESFSDSTKQESVLIITRDSVNTDLINAKNGICFLNDEIIFVMAPEKKYGILSDYLGFGTSDTYLARIETNQLSHITYFNPDFPFPYQPGSFSVTRDNQTLYFSRIRSEDDATKEHYGIYKTSLIRNTDKKRKQKHPKIDLLEFCNKDHSYLHPALSRDDKILVFSTDLPDSHAGLNLFYAKSTPNGWTDPVSLQGDINSDANECFPFLDKDNNLYFSSDRKNGQGGYDIYYARFNGNSWSDPVNMGNSINSPADEIMFKRSRNDTNAVYVQETNNDGSRAKFLLALNAKKGNVQTSNNKPSETRHIQTPVKLSSTPTAIPNDNNKISTKATGDEGKKTKNIGITPNPQTEKKITQEVSAPKIQKDSEKTPETLPIVFRVQLLASTTSKGDFVITINQVDYPAFEYFYKGAYRYTIGAFDNVNDAVKLSGLCRKAGYNQAFVVALQGKKRILDPAVFKR